MNLSRKWLNEYTQVSVSDREFAEAMTLSGSKVETFSVGGADIRGVVVGRVLSIVPHPDSDHMFVTEMDVGTGTPVRVVTGAQNVRVGDLCPTALDGALLPGNKEIHSGTLRGVVSDGMLCSFGELGLEQRDFPTAYEDGIWILSDDPELTGLTPGQDIVSAVGLDDVTVEFEITPNRPDCLSMIGLAREAAATFGTELTLHDPQVNGGGAGDLAELLDVTTPAADLVPRYTARMVRNVRIAPSPKWMRERLRAMGIRPINNIVDITNYVMLEYGQPMHAFDYRYVQGGRIIVRRAAEGETLTTLDGNLRSLTPDMLVIADETRAVGLAGIMGGENSEIVDDTTDVVFESACFDGTCIRKTALRLGMRTEASGKFEKGLDPLNTLPALQRACELVELLGAGEVVDGVIDVLNAIPQPTVLPLEPDKINALLGTDIPEAEMIRILQKLGFTVTDGAVTVPSWRGDVKEMADLAEEVARFFGYDNIPVTLMRGQTTMGGYSPVQQLERTLGQACRSCGFDEIITYSFISPSYYDKIRWPEDDPRRDSFRILNPLGEDTSIMRTTVLPSMLEILVRNRNNRNLAARLYEVGRIYLPGGPDGLAIEKRVLSLGMYGPGCDFFGLKGVVDAILETIRAEGARYVPCTDDPSYHPGRCARLFVGDTLVGVLGQIHPAAAKNYGVSDELFCAELSFEALSLVRGADPEYVPLPRFPAVSRDLALVCEERYTVGAIQEQIRAAAGELLREITVFDVYRGLPIPVGKKSVAFSLTFRADDRTLTDVDCDTEMDNIVAALNRAIGASIRS